jgi:transposase
MLYCETAFVITDIPPNPPIVKRLAASAVLRRAHHRERYREWWARARFAHPAAYQRHCERSEAIHFTAAPGESWIASSHPPSPEGGLRRTRVLLAMT